MKEKKIFIILISILIIGFFISNYLNKDNNKDILVNIVKTENNNIDLENNNGEPFLVKNIEYENIIIKLKKDFKSGIIIYKNNKYFLTEKDIQDDGDNLEIFFNTNKKIFYVEKKDLIKEN